MLIVIQLKWILSNGRYMGRRKRNILGVDIIRSIWKDKKKFLSILVIVFIGSGFFAGIYSTSPDMKNTAQEYFQRENLMDLRIKSTLGFDTDDVKAIKERAGVIEAELGHSADFYAGSKGEAKIIVSTYSYNQNNNLNKITIKEGRAPKTSNECLIEHNVHLPPNFGLGDIIYLEKEKENEVFNILKENAFKIVGIIESPLYIGVGRGKSDIGNGSVSAFMYLPEEVYSNSFYSDIYATYENTHDISPFGGEYKELIERNSKDMKKVKDQRIEERYEQSIGMALEDLDKLKDEIKKSQAELKENTDTLQKEIDKQEKDLKKLEKKYKKETKDYKKQGKDILTKEENVNKEIEKIIKEVEAKNKEIEKNKKEKAKKEKELVKTEDTANQLKDILNLVIVDPLEIEKILKDVEKKDVFDKAIVTYINNYLLPPNDIVEKENAEIIIDEVLELAESEITDMDTVEKNLGDEIKLQEEEQKSKEEELEEIIREKEDFDKDNEKTEEKFEKNKKKITKTKKEIKEKKETLKLKTELLSNKIEENKKVIKTSEKAIDKIKKPVWSTFDRTSDPGYSGFEIDADRIKGISFVFPLFFLIMAIFICLTTMTRMVREQRTEIAVLKGMGASNITVASKYIMFAVIASVLGSVSGAILGMKTFPNIIFDVYRAMYYMPDMNIPVRWDVLLFCTIISTAIITITVIVATRKELKEMPAILMQPKAPKKAKRIFLEGITSLWGEINYLRKISFRNISRYKSRIAIMIVGIAGCLLLIFSGFAIKNSISSVMEKQYSEIFTYDMIGVINPNITPQETNELNKLLRVSQNVNKSNMAFQKVITLSANGVEKDTNVFVFRYGTDISEFINLRHRLTRVKLTLDDKGILINEKLANSLG